MIEFNEVLKHRRRHINHLLRGVPVEHLASERARLEALTLDELCTEYALDMFARVVGSSPVTILVV